MRVSALIISILLCSGLEAAASQCALVPKLKSITGAPTEERYFSRLKGSQDTSIQILSGMADYRGNRYLGEAELAEIQRIYDNPSYTREEKAQASFDVYLDARLKTLTPEQQSFAGEVLKKAVRGSPSEASGNQALFGSTKFHSRASYDPDQGMIIKLPKEHLESAVGFAVQVHELEHAIQWMKLGEVNFSRQTFLDKWTRGYSDRWVQYRFLAESGAIKAEAEFLAAIPETERELLAREIREDYDPAFKEIADLMLKSDLSNPEAHLSYQWTQGRYTQQQIRDLAKLTRNATPLEQLTGRALFLARSRMSKMVFAGGLFYGADSLYSHFAHSYCSEIYLRKTQAEHPLMLKYICRQNRKPNP